MSEENTERLEGSTPFEIRVLRELGNLNRRFNSLVEKVDSRLKETRPIWEAVLLRLEKIESRLDKMDAKFDVVGEQLLDMRGDVELLKKHPPAA